MEGMYLALAVKEEGEKRSKGKDGNIEQPATSRLLKQVVAMSQRMEIGGCCWCEWKWEFGRRELDEEKVYQSAEEPSHISPGFQRSAYNQSSSKTHQRFYQLANSSFPRILQNQRIASNYYLRFKNQGGCWLPPTPPTPQPQPQERKQQAAFHIR